MVRFFTVLTDQELTDTSDKHKKNWVTLRRKYCPRTVGNVNKFFQVVPWCHKNSSFGGKEFLCGRSANLCVRIFVIVFQTLFVLFEFGTGS